jgi:tRNA modification GTPase
VPLHVIDTAGLRESLDEVEKIGIARAWEEICSADVVLRLHDLTRQSQADYIQAEQEIDRQLREHLPHTVPVLEVWNKVDAIAGATPDQGLTLSAKTGAGLERLRAKLLEIAGWQAQAEGLYIARQRHVQALRQVQHHVALANEHLSSPQPALDLLAEELRLAQGALILITGEFSNEDLLGEIFSRFCIGK